MVRINAFEVEQWMDHYENTPDVLNIAETCAASVSLVELSELSQKPGGQGPFDPSAKLTYGPIRGSLALRERVASLCGRRPGEAPSGLGPDDVIITQGAISANFLTFYTLVGPGDHVICVYPTYQQLYDVPASLGAEVSLWKLEVQKGFVPDPAELEGLVKDNTKVTSTTLDIKPSNIADYLRDDRNQQPE
jgi:DNA-binding transcriptional MocR family regulator